MRIEETNVGPKLGTGPDSQYTCSPNYLVLLFYP